MNTIQPAVWVFIRRIEIFYVSFFVCIFFCFVQRERKTYFISFRTHTRSISTTNAREKECKLHLWNWMMLKDFGAFEFGFCALSICYDNHLRMWISFKRPVHLVDIYIYTKIGTQPQHECVEILHLAMPDENSDRRFKEKWIYIRKKKRVRKTRWKKIGFSFNCISQMSLFLVSFLCFIVCTFSFIRTHSRMKCTHIACGKIIVWYYRIYIQKRKKQKHRAPALQSATRIPLCFA